MLNSTANAKAQRRKSTRTNSTSSSVVTVKKAPSASSRSGSRTPHSASTARGRSPELGPEFAVLLESSFDTGAATKRSSSRPGSASGINEGVRNLNRWSHSTSDSFSGQEAQHGKKRNSSTSRTFGIHLSPNSGTAEPSLQSTQARHLGTNAPPTESANQNSYGRVTSALKPKLVLPPINVSQLIPSPGQVADTPSTGTGTPLTSELLTPSTALSGPGDYFGEQWRPRKRGASRDLTPSSAHRSPRSRASPDARRRAPKHTQQTYEPMSSHGRSAEPEMHEIPRGGHARGRTEAGTSSGDTRGSSISSARSDRERLQHHRSPAQKTLLSQALTKANDAVLLDNAQEFEEAIDAYEEACKLLRKVMQRSSGEGDKKKLQAICTTYNNRVAELLGLAASMSDLRGKALPRRPVSDESSDEDVDELYDSAQMPYGGTSMQSSLSLTDLPPRRQSLLPFGREEISQSLLSHTTPKLELAQPYPSEESDEQGTFLSVDDRMRPEGMPPPLSPRRPPSPSTLAELPASSKEDSNSDLAQRARALSTETTSWLNTIDESGDSSDSRVSSILFADGDIRSNAVQAEEELLAALTAAADEAYDDLPEEETIKHGDPGDNQVLTNARRNIAIAKQLVREAEREAAASQQRRRPAVKHQPNSVVKQQEETNAADADYLDEEAEEEERLLEEMTKGFVMDEFEFNIQSKSALPRKSDSSSNFSGRTWGSSVGSTNVTSGTSLSTLAEVVPPLVKQIPPPAHPPPATALPAPPPPLPAPAPAIPASPPKPDSLQRINFDRPTSGPGVRDRRLSGQNVQQLKIETRSRRLSAASIPKAQLPPLASLETESAAGSRGIAVGNIPPPPSTAPMLEGPRTPASQPGTPVASLHSFDSALNQSPATSIIKENESTASAEMPKIVPPSPGRFQIKAMPPPPMSIRKNFSTSSLRMRNLSLTNPEPSDVSPITPGSASFPLNRETSREAPASAQATGIPTAASHGLSEGGMTIFEDPIQVAQPKTPGTPASTRPSNAPASLEPCPDSFLLRPFWLMRCLYQTIAHPRGGYVSTKLFIPKDIWRVKNVKLKYIDEKVSQCDLLTAALLKLAKVDTLDAIAVLEEMQSFESVLDQVRDALKKRLGNEVGNPGSSSMFRSATTADDAQADPSGSKNSGAPGKSYLSSWRKLRSKSSGAVLNSSYTPSSSTKDGHGKDTYTLSSLPMTPNPSSRQPRRDVRAIQTTGSFANYQASLARLFDAAQVLDQIARQVEDPGLKCSNKTQVGLELCTRNAAEFFGFFVCRFALSDIGMLLDKFVKRGSEWVLM